MYVTGSAPAKYKDLWPSCKYGAKTVDQISMPKKSN